MTVTADAEIQWSMEELTAGSEGFVAAKHSRCMGQSRLSSEDTVDDDQLSGNTHCCE
jgi:hypothetical protein